MSGYKTQGGRKVVPVSPQTFIVQVPPESLGLLTDAFVTSGLRLACNDRTMPILALSCGLRRVILVCTITNFKNRKTVARRHALRHHMGAVRRPCDDRVVTSRFLFDSLGTKIVQRS